MKQAAIDCGRRGFLSCRPEYVGDWYRLSVPRQPGNSSPSQFERVWSLSD